jgi:hypothetical protein
MDADNASTATKKLAKNKRLKDAWTNLSKLITTPSTLTNKYHQGYVHSDAGIAYRDG